jgi:hypothetical protein
MDNAIVFNSLREKIVYETNQRKQRYAGFEALVSVAHQKGIEAGNAITPNAMQVVQTDLSGNPIGKVYTCSEGLCGFAYVTLSKGNSSFALWAKKKGYFRKGYNGTFLSVQLFNQSVERKEAYANAYAQTLRNAGIDCYSHSRLD